jgi:hypothetical protein
MNRREHRCHEIGRHLARPSLAHAILLAVASAMAGPLGACSPQSSSSRSPVVLGAAESFAVLGGSTVTNTGSTTVVGDLGVSPGLAVTGFPPGMVTGGTIHAGDAVALQAQQDVTAAYNTLAGEACAHDLTGQDLGGLTLTPGVYCLSSSAQLTGALTLDAEGEPDAHFVFQIGSSLTTASNSSVLLINGAQGCHVFWQVGSSATLGTTTNFVGSILALTSISLDTGAQLFGRALARNGAVTMDTNHIESGTCTAAGGADAGVADAGAQDPDASVQDRDAGAGGCSLCGDKLIDLETDNKNCGALGNYCNWDLKCVAGACTCMVTTCGSICVDLDQNPKNCGACGHGCAADEWCDQGSCTSVCSGTICSGWCTDLMTSRRACGACDNECGPVEACIGGACVCTGTMCGDDCVDLSSSPSDCGTCGHACGTDECCTDGECVPLCKDCPETAG